MFFSFLKSNALREQKKILLQRFNFIWGQEEFLNKTINFFQQRYNIRDLVAHDTFINEGRQLINDLIAYKEKNFIFQDYREKEKHNKKMIIFYDYFYKLSDYRRQDRQKIINFFKSQNCLQEIQKNDVFYFSGEDKLNNNDYQIFKNLKKDLLFLSSLIVS